MLRTTSREVKLLVLAEEGTNNLMLALRAGLKRRVSATINRSGVKWNEVFALC